MTLVVSGLEEAGVTQNLYSFTIEINRVYICLYKLEMSLTFFSWVFLHRKS